MKDDKGNTPFHEAAKMGHFFICDIIIHKLKNCQQDINPGDHEGKTPLHEAVENGHFSIAEVIMENTTNKNPEDSKV